MCEHAAGWWGRNFGNLEPKFQTLASGSSNENHIFIHHHAWETYASGPDQMIAHCL